MLCLELDANAKVGCEAIMNNPQCDISANGYLLLDMIERNQLILVNGTSRCKGKITGGNVENSPKGVPKKCQ